MQAPITPRGNMTAAAVVAAVLLLMANVLGGAFAQDSGSNQDAIKLGSPMETDSVGGKGVASSEDNTAVATATSAGNGNVVTSLVEEADEGATATAYQTCGAQNVYYNDLTHYCCK